MFRYDTLREQWLILAFFVGLALILYWIIFYSDLHRLRKMRSEKPDDYDKNYLTVWQGIPWSVKIASVAILIFMGIYLTVHILQPYSW